MKFAGSLVTLITLAHATGFAQNGQPWLFRWQKGQILTYRVEHKTSVVETVNGNRSESISKLNVVKRWQVTDIDAKGVATLQLTLLSMRHEQTRPNGEKLLFDSTNPDASTKELREQMAPFVGKRVAVLRIDGLGRIMEVVEGSAARYESEPPFVVVLPAQAPQPGQQWQRSFQVAIDPPFGAGEKYQATQTYQFTQLGADGRAVIDMATAFKSQPESAADRLPLLQKQPQGRLLFDPRTGQLIAARLTVNKTLENHQGAGSSYQFQSDYVEELTK